MRFPLFGGEAGGVCRPGSGRGPGEHIGMCLFGTGAGVPREDVLSVREGGGVEERSGRGGGSATAAAINGAVIWCLAFACLLLAQPSAGC